MEEHILTINLDTLQTRAWKPKYPNEFSAIRIVSPIDVDLNKRGGYALGSRWVDRGEACVVKPGEFIVYKLNVGSHNSPRIIYAAVRVMQDGNTEPVHVPQEFIDGISDAKRKAAAMNSDAYAYACFIAAQQQSAEVTNPLAKFSDEDILAEAKRRGLI
ncbi:hypothetical protein D6833_09710 [Candidatus Parcubacteria bacterium]|nr:MAG: hypothetical protein D6833_09710 [Candidatus Parcubacteria bacterium]